MDDEDDFFDDDDPKYNDPDFDGYKSNGRLNPYDDFASIPTQQEAYEEETERNKEYRDWLDPVYDPLD